MRQVRNLPKTMTLLGLSLVLRLWPCVNMSLGSDGKYPEPLSTKAEIQNASPDVDDIDIRDLPVNYYPLLGKFRSLKRVRYYCRKEKAGTDAALAALVSINFTNLMYLNLNNCDGVTDEGVRTLTAVRSLRQLQMEGASMTDAGCSVIATQMQLTVLNVANCDRVTLYGLKALSGSATLEYIRFSAGRLSHEEILSLISSFKALSWCEIVDTRHELDAALLKSRGEEKKIHVSVLPKGALQDI